MGISMENRRMLQFSEPQFKTWSSDNFLISSILSKDTAYDWFMNYYVNTISVVKTDGSNAPPSVLFHPICIPTTSQFTCNLWDICPFIDKNTLNREIVKTCYRNFTDFVIDFVSNGYFIYAYLGQSKIRKQNFAHKVYITGYDKDLNLVYLSDHIDNGRFLNFTMSFEDVQYAFLEADKFIPLSDKDHRIEANSIYLIKPKDYHYKFSYKLLLQYIDNYLNSDPGTGFLASIRNTPFRKDSFYYGINLYEIIEDYLNQIIINQNFNFIDNRIFTFIFDHKLIMQKRIQYLFSNYQLAVKPLFNLADENFKYAAMCLNLYLKFGITHQEKIIDRIKEILRNLKENDKVICPEMKAKINDYFIK